jgi:hypothetical protein
MTGAVVAGLRFVESSILAWLTPIAIILVMVAGGGSPWPAAPRGVGLSVSSSVSRLPLERRR